jgi:hypothetical protein
LCPDARFIGLQPPKPDLEPSLAQNGKRLEDGREDMENNT